MPTHVFHRQHERALRREAAEHRHQRLDLLRHRHRRAGRAEQRPQRGRQLVVGLYPRGLGAPGMD